MAFRLGEAVVHFRERGFDRVNRSVLGISRSLNTASRSATGFGVAFGAAAAAGSAAAMIRMAANAETLSVQFEVLTGSAEDAASVMAEISEFAAKTPFQKMEIGDAARMLVAFGVAADDVIDELKAIGDISALTGNRIQEIAEIYGKAKVQGRLFAEDINQLTGRGIPIIGQLARQFGVAESEVRGLVTAGRVGFPEIQRAFRELTTGSGQFADGMERLSQTTAGRLSTLKDRFIELGTKIGESLVPVAEAFASFTSEAVGHFNDLADAWRSSIAEIGGSAGSATSDALNAIKELTTEVLKLYGAIVKVGQAPLSDSFDLRQPVEFMRSAAFALTSVLHDVDVSMGEIQDRMFQLRRFREGGPTPSSTDVRLATAEEMGGSLSAPSVQRQAELRRERHARGLADMAARIEARERGPAAPRFLGSMRRDDPQAPEALREFTFELGEIISSAVTQASTSQTLAFDQLNSTLQKSTLDEEALKVQRQQLAEAQATNAALNMGIAIAAIPMG